MENPPNTVLFSQSQSPKCFYTEFVREWVCSMSLTLLVLCVSNSNLGPMFVFPYQGKIDYVLLTWDVLIHAVKLLFVDA